MLHHQTLALVIGLTVAAVVLGKVLFLRWLIGRGDAKQKDARGAASEQGDEDQGFRRAG